MLIQANLSGLLNLVITALTALGVILAFKELRRGILFQRANLMMEFTNKFYGNECISNAFYAIEWDLLRYPEFLGRGEELERCVDYLLVYLDVVGELVKRGVVKARDTSLLWYEAWRVYMSKEIQKYLAFLDKWYSDQGIERRPFDGFRWLVEEIIEEELGKAQPSMHRPT